MVKLLRIQSDQIEYWEAWFNQDHIVVHSGVIGNIGEIQSVPAENKGKAEAMIQRQTAEKKREGYDTVNEELYSVIAIQYLVDGFGDVQALAKRHEIQDLFDNVLEWTGNGYCEGGDIGSGTMDVYCRVIDIGQAFNEIVNVLRERGFLAGAVIALETDEDYQVLYSERPEATLVIGPT